MASRGRTTSAGTVSLFPFLAVLVCAMGALILLLLITTRRIRQQSLSQARQEATDVIESEMLPVFPEPSESQEPELIVQEEEKVKSPPVVVYPTPELIAEVHKLKTRLSDLRANQSQSNEQLQRLREEQESLLAELARLEGEDSTNQAESERLHNLYLKLQSQTEDVEERSEKLKAEITHARQQIANADSQYSFLPYDGNSGTTYRPIVIEIESDRVTFASEGVTILATDLKGFNPRFNPIRSITQALVRFWQRQQSQTGGDASDEPYVLLVVRPGGTVGFYAVRQMLAGLKVRSGYELVTDDQPFEWPQGNIEATAIGEVLLTKMLAERDELMSVALRAGAELPDYSDRSGKFYLKEIEEVHRPIGQSALAQRGVGVSSSGGGQSSISNVDPRPRRTADSNITSQRFARSGQQPKPSGRQQAGGDKSTSVVTEQRSAVTREDRISDWLRDGSRQIPSDLNPTDPGVAGSMSADATPSTQQFEPGSPTFGQSKRNTSDDNQPAWGVRSGSGSIGFEKEIVVHVTGSQVTIGDSGAFQIDETLSVTDMNRLFTASVNRESKTWGSPPKSFYWVPAIRFVVTPSGRMHHRRLQTLCESIRLRSSVDYVSESPSASTP